MSVINGTTVEGGDDGDGAPSYIDLSNDYMSEFVKGYEKKIDDKKKQQTKAKKGLEKFIDDEPGEDDLDLEIDLEIPDEQEE
jgi:hypothetical protein